jgi:hypothetical protein
MQDVGKFVNTLLKTSKSLRGNIDDSLEAAGFEDAEVGSGLLPLARYMSRFNL